MLTSTQQYYSFVLHLSVKIEELCYLLLSTYLFSISSISIYCRQNLGILRCEDRVLLRVAGSLHLRPHRARAGRPPLLGIT